MTAEEKAELRRQGIERAVARRAAHAREMLNKHERLLAQEKRLVLKWKRVARRYEDP
jgi:hypothetical protein